MANLEGKVYAITCMSPMKPWKTLIFKTVLFLKKFGLFGGSTVKLLRLSFIHFARWVMIKRDDWPRLSSSQPREELSYDYMLFCSNFNGTWDQYIDAFSTVLPEGMNNMWRWSEGYPGSIPTTPFKEYIRKNMIDTDHYYSAYPGAATNDIKQAIQLRDELYKFAKSAKNLPPAEFKTAYERFLVSVQGNLSTTGPITHLARCDD